MSRDNIVRDKSYAFAIRIVNAYKFLGQTQRCGTSIGALIREAEHAQSEADFLNKMNIALKEANETLYWISLLKDTGYLDEAIYQSMNNDCTEIVAILASIVKSTKSKLNK